MSSRGAPCGKAPARSSAATRKRAARGACSAGAAARRGGAGRPRPHAVLRRVGRAGGGHGRAPPGRSHARGTRRAARGIRDRHRVGLVGDAAERLSRPDAVWTATIDRERRAAPPAPYGDAFAAGGAAPRAGEACRPSRLAGRPGSISLRFHALLRPPPEQLSRRSGVNQAILVDRAVAPLVDPIGEAGGRARPRSSARSTMPIG